MTINVLTTPAQTPPQPQPQFQPTPPPPPQDQAPPRDQPQSQDQPAPQDTSDAGAGDGDGSNGGGGGEGSETLEPAGFVDVDPDSVHAEAIDAVFAAGITRGCAGGPPRFCPDDPVTRAQMASFLARALDL